MEEVEADINISIIIECPHCDEYLDLMDSDIFPSLNEEGFITGKALGDIFGCENFNEIITCPECKNKIKITNIIW